MNWDNSRHQASNYVMASQDKSTIATKSCNDNPYNQVVDKKGCTSSTSQYNKNVDQSKWQQQHHHQFHHKVLTTKPKAPTCQPKKSTPNVGHPRWVSKELLISQGYYKGEGGMWIIWKPHQLLWHQIFFQH